MILPLDLWLCPACSGYGTVPVFSCCASSSSEACCGEPQAIAFDCPCCLGVGQALGEHIRSWADSVGDGSLRAEQEARELGATTQAQALKDASLRL